MNFESYLVDARDWVSSSGYQNLEWVSLLHSLLLPHPFYARYPLSYHHLHQPSPRVLPSFTPFTFNPPPSSPLVKLGLSRFVERLSRDPTTRCGSRTGACKTQDEENDDTASEASTHKSDDEKLKFVIPTSSNTVRCCHVFY